MKKEWTDKYICADQMSFSIENVSDLQTEYKTITDSQGITALEVIVDVTHGGYINKNFFYYLPDGQAKGVASFTKPFEKPVLAMWHTDGEPIGRVKEAQFFPLDALSANPADLSTPKSVIRAKALITDKESIQKILDGRFITVSSGGAPKVVPTCSICNQPVNSDECIHMKGETYDGKICFWYIGEMEYKEFTFVNTPADCSKDHAAGVIKMNLVKLDIPAIDASDKESHSHIESSIADSQDIKITCKSCNTTFDVKEVKDVYECTNCKTEITKDGEIIKPVEPSILEVKVEPAIDKDSIIATKDLEIANLVKECNTKTTELQAAQQTIDSLNATKRQLLAEKVVDISISLRRPSIKSIIEASDEIKRKELYKSMVDELLTRTTENLEVSISDLQKDIVCGIQTLERISDPSFTTKDSKKENKKQKKASERLFDAI